MNLIGTPEELTRTATHLKSEFEIKDLGKTQYCLGLKIEHCSNGILVHQWNYTWKVLRRFNEDKAKHSSTPIVVQSLDAKLNSFGPKEDDEEILEPEVPYLSAMGALLYLAQCTIPDIFFAVNLLERYSNTPTRKHWTGMKTSYITLRVQRIWACFIFTDPRVMPHLLPLESIHALLVMPTQVTYLIRTRHILKWVMSLPLEAPQSLRGQLNRP
ncbi:hypothetical protein EV1_046711 [Malus domestica]